MVVIFALCEITSGQWAVAARNLYQPILLSVGTVFSFIASDKVEIDGLRWNDWMISKFSKTETTKPGDGVDLKEEKEELSPYDKLVKESMEKKEKGKSGKVNDYKDQYMKIVEEKLKKLDFDQLSKLHKDLKDDGILFEKSNINMEVPGKIEADLHNVNF